MKPQGSSIRRFTTYSELIYPLGLSLNVELCLVCSLASLKEITKCHLMGYTPFLRAFLTNLQPMLEWLSTSEHHLRHM